MRNANGLDLDVAADLVQSEQVQGLLGVTALRGC